MSPNQPDSNPEETMYEETMPVGQSTPTNSGLRKDPNQWVGRTLGKYKITAVLGVGGMGVVLLGHDPAIVRDVAIKVLPEELSTDQSTLLRFLAEAKSAGQLNHPNTITIYEVGQEGSVHFLVMEVASGGSASTFLEQRSGYPIAEATRIVIEACKGLSAAHKRGLIHRDIKPANLLLAEDGTVKVADFGLARRTQNQTLMLTQAGQLVGTPYYMSPEQCEAREVDARSDIYSLGATYYSLLTGKAPFQEASSIVQVMFSHCNAQRPDPTKVCASVPAACTDIIQRSMATNPDQRYQTMDEMRADLEAVFAALSGAGITLPSQSGVRTMAAPVTTSASAGKVSRRGFTLAAAGGMAVVLGGVGLGYLLSGRGNNPVADDDNQSSEDGQAALPPTGEPIRVGVLHSLTGTMRDSESSVVDATILAIDKINQNGGLLGRPVEAVVADGRSREDVFAREARRLIEKERVCAVFGCWTSASRKTVVPIFEEHDHLLFYPVQYEGIEESPNVIYLGAAPNQQIIPAVKWAFAFNNRRKFFLVGSDYVFPRVAHEIIKDQLQELGIEPVGEAFLPLGSMSVKAAVEQVKSSGADVILNSINGDTNQAFFAELRRAGVTPTKVPTISFSVEEQELRQLDAEAMAGDYASWNYFQSIDTPENRDFVTRFQKKYGPQRVVTDPMEAAYVGVTLWGQAVKDAESIEPKLVRRSVLHQRMKAPEGEVRIDSATQHAFKTPRIGRVQPDGQFEVVWTASKPEQPIPYPSSRTAEQWRAYLHDLHAGWGNQWSAPQGNED